MSQLTARRAFYDTPEGQIHYRYLQAPIKDVSKSPILLLHMSATSSAYYEEMIIRLTTAGYDCYAPDMPGFGDSYECQYQPTGIDYYVNVFFTLPNLLKIPRFHLFGHHSGASIATEMAVMYPEHVLSLTLSSPALMPREDQIIFEKEQLIAYNKPTLDGTHWNKSWDFIRDHNEFSLDELQGLALDATMAWRGRLQIYTCVFKQPMIDLFGKVTCPVLGLSSLAGVLYKYMENMKKIQPNATVTMVTGGDFEVMKDAEGVCKAWIDFTDKLT